MRTVAISKPHIFMAYTKGWYCCQWGLSIGWGYTREEAYADWATCNAMRMNHAQVVCL